MHRIAIAALGALLAMPAPAQAELLVSISKAQQRIAVTVDGAELHRWPVSTGTRGYETPTGVFRPTRLERHWYSRQYNLTPMPWAMFFHRGYAMHATTEIANLGRVASHGCVRLRPDNAALLYSLVRRHGMANTKVVVMNGPLPALPDAQPMAELAGTAEMADAGALREDEATAETFAQAPRSQEITAMASGGENHAVDAYRVSVGSDERQILRERAAWLRGLDRKYGFTR